MCNLDQYVEGIKQYLDNNPNMTEVEIIMYVYLDLAKRLKFDQDFFFGGNKKQKKIYDNARKFNELNDCLECNKIICKSSSYILEYILRKIGINIRTVEDKYDFRKYKHVYNIITPKDGSEEYSIDLQDDMINIHYHDITKDFGLSLDRTGRHVISRQRQKEIHKKLGYISKENPYIDEYFYLIKEDIDLFDNFYDKLDFVLKNIDPMEYPTVDYWERRWKHERFLKRLFSTDEISKKLHVVEFFKTSNSSKKEFINGFWVNSSKGVTVYIFSKDDCGYSSYSLQEFAKKVNEEGIEYRQGIQGLRAELNKLKIEVSR